MGWPWAAVAGSILIVGCGDASPRPITTSEAGTGGGGGPNAAGTGGAGGIGGLPNQGGGSGGAGGLPGTSCPSAGAPNGPPATPRPWSASTDFTEATTCSTPATDLDVCACDGKVCAADQKCLQVVQPAPSVIGGPDTAFNGCFALCEADTDCEAPAVCVGNLYGLRTCAAVACRRDSDCTAAACGICSPGYLVGHAGAVYSVPNQSTCYYPQL